MKTLLNLVFLFGAASSGFAQTAAPAATPQPLPPGPLLNPVPDNIQWTVTSNDASGGQTVATTPTDPNAKPTPKPLAAKTVVGQSVGDVRHVVTTYGNGAKMEVWKKAHVRRNRDLSASDSKTEVWEKDGTQYVTSTGWKVPVISDAAPDDLYEDLGWIAAKNFEKIVKINGVDCMIFHDTILPPGTRIARSSGPLKDLPPGFTPPPVAAAVDPESLKVKAVACVEVDRRLPTAVQIGDEVTTFKFDPLDPQTVLAPPAEVDAAISVRAQQAQAATRKSAHP